MRPGLLSGGFWLLCSLAGCGDSQNDAAGGGGGAGGRVDSAGSVGRAAPAGSSNDEAGSGGADHAGGASDPGNAGSSGEGTSEAGANGEAGAAETAGSSGAGGVGGKAGAGGAGSAGTAGSTGTAGSASVQMIPCNVYAALSVCRNCHTSPPIGGAPIALMTLADLQENAGSAYSAIATGTMPPGGSLTSSESELLLDWLLADAKGVAQAACP